MQYENRLRGWLPSALIVCALVLLIPPGAMAEILDDLDVRAEGNDAVVRIRFGARVQYLAHAPLGTADLVEIAFVLVSNDAQQTTVEEYRRIPGNGTFPAVTVTYPVQLTTTTKRVRVQFSRRVQFTVRPGGDSRTIEVVIADVGKDVVSRRAAPTLTAKPGQQPAPTPTIEQRFAITLQTFPTADMSSAKPVPSQFQEYTVFSSQTVRDGKSEHELNLGYFASREAAEQVRSALLARFPNARVIDLGQRRQQNLLAAAEAAEQGAVPRMPPAPGPPKPKPSAPQPPPEPTQQSPIVAAPIVPDADLDRRAAELMTKGREVLAAGNAEAATELFNQLLFLPPNRYSQEAQELVGLARERSGELAKAKAEYELYLRLFPEGEGAARVRERLAKLDQALAAGPSARPAPVVERPTLRTFNGALSQFYYGGRSRIDTAFNTPVLPGRQTLSSVDQSSLVTTLDLNGRVRTTDSDVRLVFRDNYTWSFLDTIPSFNRLNAAYVEYRGLQNSLAGRLGRQVGLSGGVPARFDGAIGGVGFAPKWRVNAVAGSPVEFPEINSRRFFYGLNVDFENLADRWHGNLFAINQTVDGILDRRAVGTELRYFDTAGRLLYGLVDYDVSYKVFNITTLQGTWQTPGQTIVNALYDRRRAPTLTTTNAILGQGTTSIRTLLQTQTEDQLRQQAKDITAVATQGLLGFTTPVNTTWQVGADVRLTNVGALPATVINNVPVPAQPSTGNIWSYVVSAIGSKLYSARDINVFSVTLLNGPTLRGQLYSYDNVSVLYDAWTLQPSLRYYMQKDSFDTRLKRLTPGLRISYRWRQNVSFEGEYNWEKTRTSSPALEDNTVRQFWYFGYRLDL